MKATRKLVYIFMVVIVAGLFPGQVTNGESVSQSMRTFARQVLDAYEHLDAAAIKSHYAKEPDAVFFWERAMSYGWNDVNRTIDAFVKHVAKVTMTASDIRAGGAGNTGWLAARFHVEREGYNGVKMTTDGRWTMVAEKRKGRWVIIHEHASFPVPEESNRLDWQLVRTTGDKPSARGGGKLVAIGDTLMMFSGFYECFDKTKCEHTYFNDVYLLDLKSNRWEKKKPFSRTGGLPGGRAFPGGATYARKNSAVFFGGTFYTVNLSPALVYGDMWEYDLKTNTLAEIRYANQGPGPRLGMEIVIKDDMLYAFGGYDQSFKAHNDLWSFNLLTNTWQQLKQDNDPASPSKRYIFRFQLSESGDDIYIFGGNYREAYTIQRNDTWKYNIPTNTFTVLVSEQDTNISGRTHGVCAVIGKTFVIGLGDIHAGGCLTDQASEHQNPTNEVWRLNTADPSAKWKQVQIGFGPQPLKRVVYTQAGDRLYVTHGFDYKCGSADAQGAVYNLEMYSLPLERLR
jgi:ketosteroid isomerase-like protein/N-acetylneuraminic acid mutarotase